MTTRRSAFAVPAFRRLLVGETVSNVGDSALFLTLGVWAKDLTGSSSAAGLVFFFLALPVLASPLFGQLADRVRRRPLLLATNALAGVGVLALLLVDSADDLWLLYAVAAGYGVVGYVTAPARSGLLRDLLEDHQLDTANGTLMTLDQGLRVVSPLLGAGLYTAVGGQALAALASATFGLAVLALLTVRVQESEPEPHGREPWAQEVSAGFRHVARTPALRRITACLAASMLVIGLADTALFSVVDEGLGREPAFFGVLMSAQGAGSIAGGVVSVWLLRRLGGQRLVGLALVAFALSGLTMFASQDQVVLAGRVLGGAAIPWAFVPAATVRQRMTPPRLQGRTSSAVNLAITLPQTASIAAGAALLTVADFRWSLAAIAVVTSAAALPLLLRRPAPERLAADEDGASGMPADPAPLSRS
ncbi:MFS transporter [Angustibacter speluncae]